MVTAQHNTAPTFKNDLQVVDVLDARITTGKHDNFGINYPTRLCIAGLERERDRQFDSPLCFHEHL